MKGHIRTGMHLVAVLCASAALSLAQVNSSAAAPAAQQPNTAQAGPGTINYVEGQASLDGASLAPSEVGRVALQNGGTISTDNGYVEVLLTPGAFLRIGHNSEVRMEHAGLADTQFTIVRGVADVEVDQLVRGANLTAKVDGAVAQLDKNGLYGFDASAQSIRVFDGKATVTEADHKETLGGGHELLLANENPWKKHSFDEHKAKEEPLYVWSRIRSQDEARASYLSARNVTAYAAANPGWFWNPYLGFYSFWPADAFLYSPFGYGWGFYSPVYFGGYGFYRPGLYHGAYRSAGFVGAAHVGGFHGGGRR